MKYVRFSEFASYGTSSFWFSFLIDSDKVLDNLVEIAENYPLTELKNSYSNGDYLEYFIVKIPKDTHIGIVTFFQDTSGNYIGELLFPKFLGEKINTKITEHLQELFYKMLPNIPKEKINLQIIKTDFDHFELDKDYIKALELSGNLPTEIKPINFTGMVYNKIYSNENKGYINEAILPL